MEKMNPEIMKLLYGQNVKWFYDLDFEGTPFEDDPFSIHKSVVENIEQKLARGDVQAFLDGYSTWEKSNVKDNKNPKGMFIWKLKDFAENGVSDVIAAKELSKIKKNKKRNYWQDDHVPTGINFSDEVKVQFEHWWNTADNEDKEIIFPKPGWIREYSDELYKLGVRAEWCLAHMGVDWLGNPI